ncbi:hypothetical protein DY218_28665 [Streptomyces triticagri]|uniref:Uncharacterized protein n=1 Tax=Streptomyces triticagri TaxID=2293568 RepID=A0A372LXB5_9ACTN|nr:hypothetical protein [Streptomyces triticagri]RFU83281.1 hypothetical protein DY218_28665 [Streptomyces triticagri]
MPLALAASGRFVKAGLLLAAAGVAALVLISCGFEQGPAGRVVDKDRNYYPSTKTWTYKLTVRTKDGGEHRFRVGQGDYNDCYRGSKYPTCTNR